jgi:hypothetical protein
MAIVPGTPGVKFTQFVVGGDQVLGDRIVGVRNGMNTIFNANTGNANGFARTINLVGHGFAVGQIIALNNAGVYVLAQANAAANANVVGIVSMVIDANNFMLTFGGYMTFLVGAVPGDVYFLSALAAGVVTNVAPVAPGDIRKVLYVTDSPTSGYWLNYIGQQL